MASEVEIMRMYEPPTQVCHIDDDGRCEDLFPIFIYCIVLPAAILLIALLALALIMCCTRKSCTCKKYSSLEPQNDVIQMESYNTIRRASANLRHMSHNRETPITTTRFRSMTLDCSYRRARRGRESCHSAPGSLQRQNRNRTVSSASQNAPPPPPAYSMHNDDVFYGPDFLPPTEDLQSNVHYEDSPERNGSGAQPLLYQHQYNN